MKDSGPPQIGTDRQRFVDDFWIDESKGVSRLLHHPVRRDGAIATKYPCEEGITAYTRW